MHVAGFGMQTDPTALFGWVTAVGARDDVLIDYFAGIGDFPVQISIRPEFFDHVDLHFNAEAAQLEMLGADPDNNHTRGARDLSW